MLTSAREHYTRSALIARSAARQASRARGLVAVATAVTAHQVAQAQTSEAAVAAMLVEQGTPVETAHRLNALAFTTSTDTLSKMLQTAGAAGLERLVESLVQSSGRTAESVASTARNVSHVRYLQPPSCSRCAVLAGRVYRYSDGFQRHPHCDCVMVPVTDSRSTLVQDPTELMQRGLVTGLSKADATAINSGADFNQVVNVRSKAAGLTESGRVLARAGRPTPEGIYRMSTTNDEAVSLLTKFGYLRP